MSSTFKPVLLVLTLAVALAGCKRTPQPPPGGAPFSKPTAAGAATDPATPTSAPGGRPTPTVPNPDTTHALIRGKITGPDGLPVADVAITIVEGTSPWPAMATFSSAAGEYQWIVDPGTYTLEASRDGYGPGRGEVTAEGGQPSTLDLELTQP